MKKSFGEGIEFAGIQEKFAAVRQAAQKKEIPIESVEAYLREIKFLQENSSTKADPSLDYIWVLSARSTYSKISKNDNHVVHDVEDDYNRVELGLKIAREIAALRSKEKVLTNEIIEEFGPLIIYNGRPVQNRYLKKALAEGKIKNYPACKFCILEIDSQQSTKSQFISLKNEIALLGKSLGIITHTYHFPRVARLIESVAIHPFGPTKIIAYQVDPYLQAPGAQQDMLGEIQRIPAYIEKGDLAPTPSAHIINFSQ